LIIGKHAENYVLAGGRVSRRFRQLGSAFNQRLRLLWRAVVNSKGIASRQQATGHA